MCFDQSFNFGYHWELGSGTLAFGIHRLSNYLSSLLYKYLSRGFWVYYCVASYIIPAPISFLLISYFLLYLDLYCFRGSWRVLICASDAISFCFGLTFACFWNWLCYNWSVECVDPEILMPWRLSHCYNDLWHYSNAFNCFTPACKIASADLAHETWTLVAWPPIFPSDLKTLFWLLAPILIHSWASCHSTRVCGKATTDCSSDYCDRY